ncbi:hypothetical protein GHA01_15280 [Novacetimonas hansenii]|uniref:Uncharacterized protein n=4 Tax=Acetobacterales TaxID=3120395 RepID=A0ABQ0SEV2_NOVHA|nr:hypothetical protein GXY_06268 [Novacetimonas hansenii ATCC 23769]GAN84175.1 hypothetical protein Gaha_0133_032 [Novacetimonas hansenii JCM 7643]GBQ60806.1 hypothetical protein AA0243_2441 [Novacetimonas hansenii NRIC 0243]GEC63679.1 hypothetical protein GHA01_15280 [Novacetimonas hansenii]
MFPNLGPCGAKPEAVADMSRTTACYQFLDDAYSDNAMIETLKCWSVNNTAMMEMAEGRLTTTDAAIRQEAIEKRLDRIKAYGTIRADVVTHVESSVDAQLLALDEMASAGQCFDEISKIHRGAAMATSLFDANFKVGATVRWQHLTACTLNPEAAAIHFAWKQRNNLLATMAAKDVTSFLLNIHLDAPAPLVWTGAVPGKDEDTTYRWQAEVVTPPGFKFEVTSVKTLSAAGVPDRLVMVEAKYPASGSPMPSP